MIWEQIQRMPSHGYTCGHCGMALASDRGWRATAIEGQPTKNNPLLAKIYVCHNCYRPSYFTAQGGGQTPGVTFGLPVQNVTDKTLTDIYEEARRATSAGCFTAAVLCCRKLLMHLAVAKGAAEGGSFKSYVEYLSNKGYVPPDCKLWVDQIRDTGNEANHEIVVMKQEDAEHLISFCAMLMRIFYEFPAVARARITPKPTLTAAS